jgi:uncharacterized protein YggE
MPPVCRSVLPAFRRATEDMLMMLRWCCSALVLWLSAAGTAHGQAPPATVGVPHQPPTPVVVTIGDATVRLPPDRAYLTLSTETRAPKPADAQQRNAQAMAAVQQKLEAARLPKDSVRTLAYSLDEEYEFANNRRTSRGYRAVNTIEVRLDDIARVGEVLDLAVAAGATNAHGIRFDLKDREVAERQALRLAVANARARAEAAAAGANASIVTVIRIEEQGRVVPMPRGPQMMRATAADAAVETPIAAGDIEISASVALTATIK